MRRLILRWPPLKEEKRKKRPFHYACLITTLEPAEIIRQLHLPAHTIDNEDAVTLAYSRLYDKRGGTVEVEIKESKQGIGINKRSKKRFAAQQIVMLLGSLTHNVLVWSRRWLSPDAARLARYGALPGIAEIRVKIGHSGRQLLLYQSSSPSSISDKGGGTMLRSIT